MAAVTRSQSAPTRLARALVALARLAIRERVMLAAKVSLLGLVSLSSSLCFEIRLLAYTERPLGSLQISMSA